METITSIVRKKKSNESSPTIKTLFEFGYSTEMFCNLKCHAVHLVEYLQFFSPHIKNLDECRIIRITTASESWGAYGDTFSQVNKKQAEICTKDKHLEDTGL